MSESVAPDKGFYEEIDRKACWTDMVEMDQQSRNSLGRIQFLQHLGLACGILLGWDAQGYWIRVENSRLRARRLCGTGLFGPLASVLLSVITTECAHIATRFF